MEVLLTRAETCPIRAIANSTLIPVESYRSPFHYMSFTRARIHIQPSHCLSRYSQKWRNEDISCATGGNICGALTEKPDWPSPTEMHMYIRKSYVYDVPMQNHHRAQGATAQCIHGCIMRMREARALTLKFKWWKIDPHRYILHFEGRQREQLPSEIARCSRYVALMGFKDF